MQIFRSFNLGGVCFAQSIISYPFFSIKKLLLYFGGILLENIIENDAQNTAQYIETDERSEIMQQYATFNLGDEEHGIEITKVQNIIVFQKLTMIPNVPDFIKGVLNLRGTVIPVIDLRQKFGMEENEYSKYTVIIILKTTGRIMGITVDAISNIVSLTDQDIQEVPSFNINVRTDFIKGMGKRDNKLVILLDIDKILSPEELEGVE
jgi:purine-binding chemotaxis protein CheW